MLGFLVATIAYGGVWLAVALLFSVLFRAPATAALAALGIWLLFALFWSVLTPLVANLIAGPPEGVFGPRLAFLQTQQIIDRLSPNTLYAESALALLHPATRALGPVLISQLQGALLGRAVAGVAELHPDLAAADRARRRDDRHFRHRLCRLPAPGDPRLERNTCIRYSEWRSGSRRGRGCATMPQHPTAPGGNDDDPRL